MFSTCPICGQSIDGALACDECLAKLDYEKYSKCRECGRNMIDSRKSLLEGGYFKSIEDVKKMFGNESPICIGCDFAQWG